MLHFRLLLFIPFLFLFSCSNNESAKEEKENSEDSKSRISELSENRVESIESGSLKKDENIKSYEFYGYIDTYTVVVHLSIDEEKNVEGNYYYKKYKEEIKLKGKFEYCEYCGGEATPCEHLELYEYVDNEKGAKWYFECFDAQIYNYPDLYRSLNGTWEDDSTLHKVSLISSQTTQYLEPNSRLVFNSKDESDKFFKKHQIHNNQIENKRFYVFAIDHDQQYEHPLPLGLELNQFNGDISTYYLNDEDVFENDYNSIPLSELNRKKISSEKVTYVFNELNDDKLTYNDLSISLSELESKGYYVQDEHSWLISNSGSVMGYYPTHDQINFYEKPSSKSKVIFTEASESLGFIKILDIQLHNMEYWAKARFEYYDHVPCSEEIREPLPAVDGWIKLYDKQNKLAITYYSGGC